MLSARLLVLSVHDDGLRCVLVLSRNIAACCALKFSFERLGFVSITAAR